MFVNYNQGCPGKVSLRLYPSESIHLSQCGHPCSCTHGCWPARTCCTIPRRNTGPIREEVLPFRVLVWIICDKCFHIWDIWGRCLCRQLHMGITFGGCSENLFGLLKMALQEESLKQLKTKWFWQCQCVNSYCHLFSYLSMASWVYSSSGIPQQWEKGPDPSFIHSRNVYWAITMVTEEGREWPSSLTGLIFYWAK